jgi:hypothetical protein
MQHAAAPRASPARARASETAARRIIGVDPHLRTAELDVSLRLELARVLAYPLQLLRLRRRSLRMLRAAEARALHARVRALVIAVRRMVGVELALRTAGTGVRRTLVLARRGEMSGM